MQTALRYLMARDESTPTQQHRYETTKVTNMHTNSLIAHIKRPSVSTSDPRDVLHKTQLFNSRADVTIKISELFIEFFIRIMCTTCRFLKFF